MYVAIVTTFVVLVVWGRVAAVVRAAKKHDK